MFLYPPWFCITTHKSDLLIYQEYSSYFNLIKSIKQYIKISVNQNVILINNRFVYRRFLNFRELDSIWKKSVQIVKENAHFFLINYPLSCHAFPLLLSCRLLVESVLFCFACKINMLTICFWFCNALCCFFPTRSHDSWGPAQCRKSSVKYK